MSREKLIVYILFCKSVFGFSRGITCKKKSNQKYGDYNTLIKHSDEIGGLLNVWVGTDIPGLREASNHKTDRQTNKNEGDK